MTIHVGQGGFDYGPLKRPRGPQQPVDQAHTKPFPQKEPFRIGHYVIVEEKDDYLICEGFDPNAINPLGQRSPNLRKTINVAKPSLLMRAPFDETTVEMRVDGELTDVTFEYDDNELGKRTASWTVGVAVFQEVQRIEMPYFAGDAIMAVEVARSAGYDGLKTSTVTTEKGGRLTWMDLNNSGRRWVRASAIQYCELTEDMSATTSGEASANELDATGVATGQTMTVIDPLGIFESASTGDVTFGAKGLAMPDRYGNLVFFPLECA